LISKSPGWTPTTGALNVTVTSDRLLTVEPGAGEML